MIIRRRDLAILILVGLTSGCGRPAAPPADTGPAQSLRVGGPPNISMLPLLARASGDPAASGFDWVPIQTGKLAMDALLAGNIDVGVLVDSNIAFARFQGGEDLAIIASIQRKRDDGLVVRADRKIRTAADLKGRRIGFLMGTTSHVFLTRYLAAHGLKTADATLVAMAAPPALQAAVVQGDVDAVSVWQPFRYNALASLREKGGELKNGGEYVAQALLVTRRSRSNERGAAITALLRSLITSEQRLHSDSDWAIRTLAQAIPMPEEALRGTWQEYDTTVRLDDTLASLLEEEGQWIATLPDTAGRQVPDYRTSIAPEWLRAISPDRVPASR